MTGPDDPPPPPSPAPRHLELPDLPPELAGRLAFDRAAPRRLRKAEVPDEAKEVLRQVWDGIVADVWDEVNGTPRRQLLSRERITAILARVGERLQQGERALIVTATYYPLPGQRPWTHAATAGVGAGGAAVAEGLAAVGTAGAGAAVAVTSAIVGELFESYVAASARTRQYQRAGRSPDPALVATDMAESLGYADSAGRRVDRQMTGKVLAWLGRSLTKRTSSRFARGLVPVAGAAASAGLASRDVVRVTRLDLRPPAEDELHRLAEDLDDQDEAAAARSWLAALVPPPDDDRPSPPSSGPPPPPPPPPTGPAGGA